MALTAAQKKELSKSLYGAGYTKTQTAELLDISDALIETYWAEWDAAWIKVVSDPMIVTHRGAVLSAEHGA